jgi:hypothetical protein
MKKLPYLLLLALTINSLVSAQNYKHVVTPTQMYIDGNTLHAQPGDTVCIQASTKRYLRFINFHGTPEKYIVFINSGGPVIVQNTDMTYCLKLGNCSYFKFTGTGDSNTKYGIKVLRSREGANGMSVDDCCTNFEVDHVEVANTGFAGIMSKTDPKCDLSTNRGNFTQYQSIFHDNYIHNTGGEGMYIGHSFYSGWTTTCGGVSTVLIPSVMKGVRVYNNIVDSAHWDGIQVGSASEDCEIYNNKVTNFGVDCTYAQNNGIQIGGGTTGKCYNNYIANGSGCGIIVFGTGNNDFYNNIIVNAGYNYFPTDSTKRVHGILCDDRATIPGSSFNFYNNTIITPKTDGIRLMSTISRNNKFFNNVILKPGSLKSYSKYSKENPYINIGSKAGVDAVVSHNYLDKDLVNIKFVDAPNGNYRLSAGSPAIDAGMDLLLYGINYDLDNHPRPSGSAFDAGAFEFQGDTVATAPSTNLLMMSSLATASTLQTDSLTSELQSLTDFSVYPNPNNGRFLIQRDNLSNVNVSVCNSMGNPIYRINNICDNYRELNLPKKVSKGKYYLTLSNDESSTTKIIIIN